MFCPITTMQFDLFLSEAVNFSIFSGGHHFTLPILSQCFHGHVSSVQHKVEI